MLTTPFTFFSTASCAYKVGARPRFADIDPATFNLDPERAEAAITPRTKAIMPVHLFGQCAVMDAFVELGERHGIPVVEDAAQALGASYRSERSGEATPRRRLRSDSAAIRSFRRRISVASATAAWW